MKVDKSTALLGPPRCAPSGAAEGGPQSNGAAEAAVNMTKSRTWTLKAQLENMANGGRETADQAASGSPFCGLGIGGRGRQVALGDLGSTGYAVNFSHTVWRWRKRCR